MSPGAGPLERLLARLPGELGNVGLGLDPLSRARLEALDGTRVHFHILPPGGGEPMTMTLTVARDRLQTSPGAEGEAHLILTGTLADIARVVFGRGGGGNVRIQGDEARLQALAELFRDLQPDPAPPLEALLGRPLADDLVSAAETGAALLRSAAETLAGAARRQAQAQFLDQPRFERLLTRIEDLRLRVDRLSARTDRLAGAAPAGDSRAPAAEPLRSGES